MGTRTSHRQACKPPSRPMRNIRKHKPMDPSTFEDAGHRNVRKLVQPAKRVTPSEATSKIPLEVPDDAFVDPVDSADGVSRESQLLLLQSPDPDTVTEATEPSNIQALEESDQRPCRCCRRCLSWLCGRCRCPAHPKTA